MARLSSRHPFLLLLVGLVAALLCTAASDTSTPEPRAPQQGPGNGLNLDLHLTDRANAAPHATAIQRAAEELEKIIGSAITVDIDVDLGSEFIGYDLGTFRLEAEPVRYTREDYLEGLVATLPNSPILSRLPGGDVPTDIGPIDTICGPAILGKVVGLPDQPFGPPPSIGFNNAISFDFDPSDGIDIDKIDFAATATHAFLHLLGFTSEVGTAPGPNACMAPLDLFRVPVDTTLATFQQAQRILTTGGDHNLYLGDDEVRLMSTGLPDGAEGDGRSANHWKDDELVRTLQGIMDPTLRPGKRGFLTYNDILVLNRLGYGITKTGRPPQQTRLDSSGLLTQGKTSSSGVQGQGLPSFKIQGQGFVQGSVAKFKGQNRGTIQNSPTELQVFLTPQDVATPGLGVVTVFNPTSIDSNPLFLNIPSGTAPCGGGNALCLGGRFRVDVAWETSNRKGSGTAVKLTDDTGYFWFFNPENVEVVVKALTGNNQHYWVFYGSLTSQQWSMRVLDTQTGEIVTYFNPLRNMGSRADTLAFPTPEATPQTQSLVPAARAPEQLYAELVSSRPIEPAGAAPACAPGATTLCLNGGRFQVEVDWRVPSQGRSGVGTATPITDDTGRFWFFTSTNIELVVKVLDGRGVNGKYWVFYGALSTVEYTITVTDTLTNTVQTYFNPSGTLASKSDTSAF